MLHDRPTSLADGPGQLRRGRAALVAPGVALLGLLVLWVAELHVQSGLDRRIQEIERGALPSMVRAHALALATARLRVHVEGLLATQSPRRALEQAAIADDLSALTRDTSALDTLDWSTNVRAPIRDIQSRIEALRPQVLRSEATDQAGPFDSPSFDSLTASLRDLVSDCDNILALAAQQAEHDSNRLRNDSRHAMNLQVAAAAALALVLMALIFLAEQEHRRNQRTLEALNGELDAFCGRVAHDLLTPLTPIRGNAQLIAGGVDPTTSRALGARIVAITDRLEGLIEGLLSLARAQAHSVDRGGTDAAEVLRTVIFEMGEATRLLGAEVSLSIEPTHVHCPPSLLATVFQNLLENALRYGHREGQAARVHVRVEPAGAFGHVRFSDEGPGISAAAQAHVFEPFFQERPGHGGSGLGLATVHRVVTSCGGTISLRGDSPAGATFDILLPAVSGLGSASAPRL